MRPHGRSALDSLYFDYPFFDAPAHEAVAGDTQLHPVVIVGAGPVGMTAALTLAKYGIRSILLDNKASYNDGSRAICLSRSSFYLLERLHAQQAFLDKSLGWTRGRGYFQGEEIGHFEMPHTPDEKYLPMYNLQQQYIEQYLHQAVMASGKVELRWQSELVGLEQQTDRVVLHVQSPNGHYSLQTRYYLAADGARSMTRSLMGLRLCGQNLEGRYVIADVQMEHDFPTERRALFEPASNPGGTVLLHRQPDNIWRVDYQLAATEDEQLAMQEENIRTRVGAILEEVGHQGDWELEWWSIYSANTLCLDEYRHGRVFFVGDSAHIVPIFGVRGLNNGLLDAENIGWKLARVLNGYADDSLLDSYSPERRGATLDVFANAAKSAAFMTPPTAGHVLMRRAALALARHEVFVRPLANPRQMTPYAYLDSPLTRADLDGEHFHAGPLPGEACRNVRLAAGGYLLDYSGKGYTLLLFAPVAGWADTLRAQALPLDPEFTVLTIGQAGADITDTTGSIAGLFGLDGQTPGAYLLRPDQHVAARFIRPEPGAIVRCIA